MPMRIISTAVLAMATVLLAVEPKAGQAPPAVNVEGLLRGVKVLPDKAPDCSSLKSIVDSITRECKTNDEKAIAVYNFMILSHYHRAYPAESGGIPVLKEINTYGWSLCGGLHSEQSALWRELGWGWRFVGWDGHTTVEAKYDGRWHYLDAFLKFYAWMPDASAPGGRTIAGEDDLNNDARGLIEDAFILDQGRNAVYPKNNQFEIVGDKANWMAPAFLTCGDTVKDLVGGLKTHKSGGADAGWMGINHATVSYSAEVNLAPGFSLTNTWEPLADDGWYWSGSKIAPKHTCGNKDLRNDAGYGLVMEPYFQRVRGYANGKLLFAPDFGHDAFLKSFVSVENAKYENGALLPAAAGSVGRVTILLQSPYIMTKGSGAADGAELLEISTDGGKSFKAADLKEFSVAVKGHVAALARISFKTRLTSLRLEALVQNNPGSLPYLSPGKNVVTVSAANPAALGGNKLVVTYAYTKGYRNKSFEQLCNEGKEIAKQHNTVWSQKPTVVQKVFTAADLPAKFEIDVPTPRDKYPVYPRMLFIRREVIAPNSAPQPLPQDAVEARLGPDEELKTLPNPFLIGSQTPPQRIVRPTKTITLELKAGHFVSRSGDLPATDFIKWPKTAQEKVEPMAFLIGGDLKGLPSLKDLAAARLVFPAVRAHPEAPTKVGAVVLKTAFAAGQQYDFANLGDVVGTVVVPRLSAGDADWSPPKKFRVDVTRAMRAVASGDADFHGFALRVVPDRGVDESWTVRIHIPRKPRIYLEIDAYTE